MPISTINVDGTVNIYNKKTGAVKENVKPEELGAISPNLVAEYQTMQLPEQKAERLAAEGKIKELESPTETPVKKAERLTAEAKIKELEGGPTIKRTEGQETKFGLAKSGLSSLKEVEKFYKSDPEIISKQLIPGKFESRSFDAALFGAVDTLLRIRTGATAPESEIRRYMSAYGPKFGDKPGDVAFKLNQLQAALINEGGLSEEESNKILGKETKKEKSSEEQGVASSVLGLTDGTAPQATAAAMPATPGIVSPLATSQEAVSQATQEPGQVSIPVSRVLTGLFPGLQATQIPVIKNILAQRGSNVLEKIDRGESVTADEIIGAGGEMLRNALFAGGGLLPAIGGAIGGLTAPGKSAEERVAQAAIEGGTGLAVGAAGKVIGRVKGILTGSAKSAAAEARNAIAEGVKKSIPTEALKQEANRIAKNLPATATKAAEELTNLSKNIKPRDLVEKIDFWGQAYKASGDLKDTAAGKLYSALQRKAKEILEKEAPEILAAHKVLQKEAGLHGGISGTFRKFIYPAAIGTGVGVPISLAVSKALGRPSY